MEESQQGKMIREFQLTFRTVAALLLLSLAGRISIAKSQTKPPVPAAELDPCRRAYRVEVVSEKEIAKPNERVGMTLRLRNTSDLTCAFYEMSCSIWDNWSVKPVDGAIVVLDLDVPHACRANAPLPVRLFPQGAYELKAWVIPAPHQNRNLTRARFKVRFTSTSENEVSAFSVESEAVAIELK